MDHYQGITPKERYDNELLNEIRKTNELLENLTKMIGHHAQMSDSHEVKPRGRRKGAAS